MCLYCGMLFAFKDKKINRMKKIYCALILMLSFFITYSQNNSDSWEKQFVGTYIQLNADKEISYKEALSFFRNNSFDDKVKAEVYSFYLNRDDYGSLSTKLKTILLMYFVDYDISNPANEIYKQGKSAYVKMGGAYLNVILEEGMFTAEDKDTFLEKVIELEYLKYKEKGFDISFYESIADKYSKLERLN